MRLQLFCYLVVCIILCFFSSLYAMSNRANSIKEWNENENSIFSLVTYILITNDNFIITFIFFWFSETRPSDLYLIKKNKYIEIHSVIVRKLWLFPFSSPSVTIDYVNRKIQQFRSFSNKICKRKMSYNIQMKSHVIICRLIKQSNFVFFSHVEKYFPLFSIKRQTKIDIKSGKNFCEYVKPIEIFVPQQKLFVGFSIQ